MSKHRLLNRANEVELLIISENNIGGVEDLDRSHTRIFKDEDIELVDLPLNDNGPETSIGYLIVSCSRNSALDQLSPEDGTIIQIDI